MNQLRTAQLLDGRYQLDKLAGRGAFAQVYLATDLRLKRQIAVKVLKADLSEDENFLRRFEQEAQSSASLEHPNILTIYDFGHDGETAYIVMPYIRGGTLDQKLQKQGKFDLVQTLFYLHQAAIALDYAHRSKIVHRDIKPHNILLRDDSDHLLLSDFGIAKALSSDSSFSGTAILGTPSFMAPEQWDGKVSKMVDIYALGCLAFKLLIGQSPYLGLPIDIIMAHKTAPIPSLVERSQGELPASLQPIFDKVMAKDPHERYQSAGDFVAALRVVALGQTEASIYEIEHPTMPLSQLMVVLPPVREFTPIHPVEDVPDENLTQAETILSDQLKNSSRAFRLEVVDGVGEGSLDLNLSEQLPIITIGIKQPGSQLLYCWNDKQPWFLKAANPQAVRMISRRHSYLKLVEGVAWLFSGSPDGAPAPNGTFINGEKLEHGQGQALKDGDLIGLGPRDKNADPNLSREGGATLRFKTI